MSKKKLDSQAVVNELKGQSAFFPAQGEGQVEKTDKPEGETLQKATQKPTRKRDKALEVSSDKTRTNSRGKSRELPTRDEIQEFSFRLRDELNRKLQAEVPHMWLDELEQMARGLDVKKLELYRFIIGKFLGKVNRKKPG